MASKLVAQNNNYYSLVSFSGIISLLPNSTLGSREWQTGAPNVSGIWALSTMCLQFRCVAIGSSWQLVQGGGVRKRGTAWNHSHFLYFLLEGTTSKLPYMNINERSYRWKQMSLGRPLTGCQPHMDSVLSTWFLFSKVSTIFHDLIVSFELFYIHLQICSFIMPFVVHVLQFRNCAL